MKKKLLIMACALFMCANVFAQTQWTVNNAASWQTAVNGIANGGNNRTHTVTVSGTVSVPGTNQWLFNDVTGITVTLQGSGTLALSSNGCLLTIGSGKTVVVRDLTLQGIRDNDFSLVYIGEGTFRMEGGTISGNTVGGNGGGVTVGEGGSFTLVGGTISGNTAVYPSLPPGMETLPPMGGGVYIRSGGTFTMQGGTISGNRAGTEYSGYGNGAGVYVDVDGTFIMQNGTIGGNTILNSGHDESRGGGVYIANNSWDNRRGTFIKTGGTIYGSNETNAALRNSSREDHAVSFGNYYCDTTLPANASGNISTATALPTASRQTLNNWTRR